MKASQRLRLDRDPVDADRPLLQQLEERALVDEETFELLVSRIYPNRGIMSLLGHTGSTRMNDSRST